MKDSRLISRALTVVVGIILAVLLPRHVFGSSAYSYCDTLPPRTRIEGPVIPIVTTNWNSFTFNHSFDGNGSITATGDQASGTFLLFRSNEPNCSVELKFTAMYSSVGIAFFWNGRNNPQTFHVGNDDDYYTGSCESGGGNVFELGNSVISTGQELAMMFLLTPDHEYEYEVPFGPHFAQFTVRVRQLCYPPHEDDYYVEPLQPVSEGLALPSSLHGRIQSFAYSPQQFLYLSQHIAQVSFSVFAPRTTKRHPWCTIKAKLVYNSAGSGAHGAYISADDYATSNDNVGGHVYSLPSEFDMTIQAETTSRFKVEYWTDCKSSNQLVGYVQITGPKLTSLKPPGTMPRIANFSFTRIRDYELFLFSVSTKAPERLLVEELSLSGGTFLPEYFIGDTWSSLHPRTDVVGWEFDTATSGHAVLAFRYRLLVSDPLVVRLPTAENWTTAVRISGDRNSTIHSLYVLQSDDPSCFISVRFSPSTNLNYYFDVYQGATTSGNYIGSIYGGMHSIVNAPSNTIAVQLVRNNGRFLGLYSPLKFSLHSQLSCPQTDLTVPSTTWNKTVLGEQASLAFQAETPLNNTKPCDFEFVLLSQASDVLVLCLNSSTDYGSEPIPLKLFQLLEVQCAFKAVVHSSRQPLELAYRVTCGTDQAASVFPSPGSLRLATSNPAVLNDMTSMTSQDNLDFKLPRTWTLQASNTSCRVRVTFPVISLSRVEIYEVPATFTPETKFRPYQALKNMPRDSLAQDVEYVSCTDRVTIEIPSETWAGINHEYETPQEVLFHATYEEDCSGSIPICGSQVVLLKALAEWSNLTYDALNFNDRTIFQFANGPPNTFVEIQFLSLVEQTWLGTHGSDPYASYDSITRTVRLLAGSKVFAIAKVGPSFITPLDPNQPVQIQSNLAFAHPEQHVFTARYRLLTQAEATSEEDDVPTLIATDDPHELTLIFPSQFSAAQRDLIFQGAKDDTLINYEQWSFAFRWRVKPLNASCRPMVRFSRMDIGNGYLDGDLHKSFQHRLMVSRKRGVPFNKTCNDVVGFGIGNNRQSPLKCARMNTTYEDVQEILFRSDSRIREYEYESGYSFSPTYGWESTWGTGWTVVFFQDCNDIPVNNQQLLNVSSSQWTSLENLRVPSLLFQHAKFLLLPADPVHCFLEYNATEDISFDFDAIPFLVGIGRDQLFYGSGYTKNLTVIILGKSAAVASTFSIFQYRQSCSTPPPTGTPTSSPTSSPTTSPTEAAPPRENGWSCALDAECTSGICSTSLGMCLSVNCQGTCASKKSSSKCVAVSSSLNGCACDWIVPRRARSKGHCQVVA